MDLLIKGYWWWEDYISEKVAGILSFNNTDGGELDLFGVFSHCSMHKCVGDAPFVLHGVDDLGCKYSLFNCYVKQHTLSGYNHDVFYVNLILKGAFLERFGDVYFKSIQLSFEHLREWYRKDLVKIKEISQDETVLVCSYSNKEMSRNIQLSDNSSIMFVPHLSNQYTQYNKDIHLHQSTSAEYIDLNGFSLEKALSLTKIIQQFVSFLFLCPQYFCLLNLETTNHEYCSLFGKTPKSNKPVFGPFILYDIIENKLDQICNKWFIKSDKFYSIQDHLFRTLDSSRASGEEDFLVIAQAIDGITAINYPLSQKGGKVISGKLFDRVKAVYNHLSEIQWLNNNRMDEEVFVNTRNYYAHMNEQPNKPIASGSVFIQLYQQSQLLLTVLLMTEYGFVANEIDECLNHSIFRGYLYLRHDII